MTKKREWGNLAANEVFFKARVDDVFLLGIKLGSEGCSNWINYAEFRMMNQRNELKNYCGPRHDGVFIHDWTFIELEIGSITDKIAVIVVENLFVTMLISLSTLKRKSEIRRDYQRRCIHAGGSSVPLLEEICPPLDESRMWKSIVNSDGPRVSARELGAPRLEWADKRRAFVCGRVCGEVADIEIDNTKDCNMISERLLELLGFTASVRRFNGKLERTFNNNKN